jgi:CheY-like chemotaxis protein
MVGAKILIVEDEERLLHVLARTLERNGYMVATASTAEEAIATVAHARPDLLVLDINLPDDTGWGVLRDLAVLGITCADLVTVVMSSGYPDRRQLAEFRPHAFLSKPFAIVTLKRLIAEALDVLNIEHDRQPQELTTDS